MTHPAGHAVDSETENWPVPADMRDDLDSIKHAFFAIPLSVFVGNKFVDAENAESVLNGALAEIFFELYHYAIRGDNKDSYNGMIEQIQILQPGEVRHVDAYKRKNVRDGPIRHLPLLRTDDNALDVSKQITPNVSASSAIASSTVDRSPLALANNARNGMSKTAASKHVHVTFSEGIIPKRTTRKKTRKMLLSHPRPNSSTIARNEAGKAGRNRGNRYRTCNLTSDVNTCSQK